MEYYSAIKWNNGICSNIHGPSNIYNESDSEKQILYDTAYHSYVESKKLIQMNLFTKQKQPTDIENKAMVTKGKRGGGNDKLEVWE